METGNYWDINYKDLEKQMVDWVLPEILEEKAKQIPNKNYFQFKDKKIYTFSEVNKKANKFCNSLLDFGVEKGDVVTMMLPNCEDHVFAWFGTLKAGAIQNPMNTDLKGDFLEYQINKAEPEILLISDKYKQRFSNIINELKSVNTIILHSENNNYDLNLDNREDIKLVPYRDFVGGGGVGDPGVEVNTWDPARMLFTSGTTGPPKAVVKAHAGDYLSAFGYINALDIDGGEDVLFTAFPFYHSNAQVLSIYPAMIAGTRVHTYEQFSTSKFWGWVEDKECTIANTLGPVPYWLWDQEEKPDDSETPMRIMLQSPAPSEEEIYYGFQERFDLDIVEGYGLTETGAVTYTPINNEKLGSCGRPAVGYDVKVVDPESGFECGAGEEGEIVVRNKLPWVTLLEYYGDPEKTVEAWENLWFHTGDAGMFDEDGYLHFRGRIKYYIRVKGENISPEEIEGTVRGHPGVSEVAAVGIPDPDAEEQVGLFVLLDEGGDLSEEEYYEWCVDELPEFMHPKHIVFVDEFPRTSTDRIRKFKLVEMWEDGEFEDRAYSVGR